jgi:hypothetical protein
MGKVQDALSRIEAAVARLERASLAGSNGHATSTAQTDHAAVAELTDSVARRLDAVIGRLDRALEG